MDTIQYITDIIFGSCTLIISIYLLIKELNSKKVTNHDLIISAYNSMNALGLQSDENLIALAEVLYPESKENFDLLRQRIFAYHALNAAELTFLSKKHKIIRRKIADPILNDLLQSMLSNNEVRKILLFGTYDKEFHKFANSIIEKIDKEQSAKEKQVVSSKGKE